MTNPAAASSRSGRGRNQQAGGFSPTLSSAPGSASHNDGDARQPHPKNSAPRILVEGSDALPEGRGISLGNILYQFRPEEITKALEGEEFGAFDQIQISIGPVTSRNPGYCFVEFSTREDAQAALRTMSGVTVRGRSLKTETPTFAIPLGHTLL